MVHPRSPSIAQVRGDSKLRGSPGPLRFASELEWQTIKMLAIEAQSPVRRWRRASAIPCVGILLAAVALGSEGAPQQVATSSAPTSVEELQARAQQLVEARDFEGAAKIYEQILHVTPDSSQVLNNLGAAYAQLGRYPQAVKAYEQALHREPHSFPLLLNLGLAHFKSGNFQGAMAPLEEAVSVKPEDPQARTLLAMSYYSAKQYQRASEQFEKLIAEKPDDPTLQYLLAESYLWSDQEEKMLSYFRQILDRSPDSVTIHMLMGEADDGLDRTEDAIKEFKTAAELAPDQPNVHFGLGYLYWKRHDYEQATTELQREIQLGGSVAKSEAYLGDISPSSRKNPNRRGRCCSRRSDSSPTFASPIMTSVFWTRRKESTPRQSPSCAKPSVSTQRRPTLISAWRRCFANKERRTSRRPN